MMPHFGGFRPTDHYLPQDPVAFSACYPFPNVSQLSLAFPIPDALLFGMWMNIAYINCVSLCLRDRNSRITSHVPGPEILGHHSWEIKREFEHVICDVLARIETGLLNEFMGTTGRADHVGCSGDTVVGRVMFSVHYFRQAQSADCAEPFPIFPSRRFRSGFGKTLNDSANLILLRCDLCSSDAAGRSNTCP
jgi:hypothetical protein